MAISFEAIRILCIDWVQIRSVSGLPRFKLSGVESFRWNSHYLNRESVVSSRPPGKAGV